MQSFLITGGTKKERDERAKKEGQVENINTRLMEISDCEKQTIGIEKVRELKKFLETKSGLLGKKVVIIPEAQHLTIPAQNALLKTLEEPPSRTIIILTAPNRGLLLATVVSRCSNIDLKHTVKPIAEEGFTPVFKSDAEVLDFFAGNPSIYKSVKTAENFMEQKEVALSKEKTWKNAQRLQLLYRFKEFLYCPGANIRLILENIFLVPPEDEL
ncbi:hypothetical protein COT49_01550 [candidate division WWE3 bacterium CG08_land_8_20_14_0_20_40_13]|uniref:DNA polymerase III subunit delta n=1 Tax=candidate division WWE3 bacterium CG08_land_8_20_14_0_20_40_13 TaxID=1975084 RepID=A0A2H0XE07_UNCKA|nr:MAG: hypothetical protein COT49_01550 [candidate division WWE3 bacterium CG08_land_8_20_14_0_20_40_13]